MSAHALHNLGIVGVLGQVGADSPGTPAQGSLGSLVPSSVVTDYRNDGQVEPNVGFHIETGQPERAVSIHDDNLFAWPGQLGCGGEPATSSQTTEATRIQPMAGKIDSQHPGSEGHPVASITDDGGVVV